MTHGSAQILASLNRPPWFQTTAESYAQSSQDRKDRNCRGGRQGPGERGAGVGGLVFMGTHFQFPECREGWWGCLPENVHVVNTTEPGTSDGEHDTFYVVCVLPQ